MPFRAALSSPAAEPPRRGRHAPRHPLPRRLLGCGAVLLLCAAAACAEASVDTIDRDVFVATYVDLRVAALDTDSIRLGDADREAILQRHGVSEDDLTTFVEAHAAELEFMRDVWSDVEAAMDRETGAPVEPNG